MKISGIINQQQGLLGFGAGLGPFSIEGYREFLIRVPRSIYAHRPRFIRHFHKVGVRFRHQLVQTIQQLGSFCDRFSRFIFIGKFLEPVPNTAGIPAAERSGQFPQRILTIIHLIPIFIGIVVKRKLVDVGCQLLDRVQLRFRGSSQVNTALLADNLIVPVDVVNQLTGGLIDSFQTGPQLRQLLTLAPVGDVAEAVLAGLDTVILANRVGNALGFHLLGIAVFLLGRLLVTGPNRFLLSLSVVVQLAVGDLMDGGGNGLYLAHASTESGTGADRRRASMKAS